MEIDKIKEILLTVCSCIKSFDNDLEKFISNKLDKPYEYEYSKTLINQELDNMFKYALPECLELDYDISQVMSATDIHGDFYAFINVLYKFIKLLETDNKAILIFTGDYLDRGPDEMLCLILLVKLINADLKTIYFLRGNHDTDDFASSNCCNKNLKDELYKSVVPRLSTCFRVMPYMIALKINNKNILFTHAGLPIYKTNEYVKLEENSLHYVKKQAYKNVDIESLKKTLNPYAKSSSIKKTNPFFRKPSNPFNKSSENDNKNPFIKKPIIKTENDNKNKTSDEKPNPFAKQSTNPFMKQISKDVKNDNKDEKPNPFAKTSSNPFMKKPSSSLAEISKDTNKDKSSKNPFAKTSSNPFMKKPSNESLKNDNKDEVKNDNKDKKQDPFRSPSAADIEKLKQLPDEEKKQLIHRYIAQKTYVEKNILRAPPKSAVLGNQKAIIDNALKQFNSDKHKEYFILKFNKFNHSNDYSQFISEYRPNSTLTKDNIVFTYEELIYKIDKYKTRNIICNNMYSYKTNIEFFIKAIINVFDYVDGLENEEQINIEKEDIKDEINILYEELKQNIQVKFLYENEWNDFLNASKYDISKIPNDIIVGTFDIEQINAFCTNVCICVLDKLDKYKVNIDDFDNKCMKYVDKCVNGLINKLNELNKSNEFNRNECVKLFSVYNDIISNPSQTYKDDDNIMNKLYNFNFDDFISFSIDERHSTTWTDIEYDCSFISDIEVYSLNKDGRYSIGLKKILEAMNRNNIDIIVRGHQSQILSHAKRVVCTNIEKNIDVITDTLNKNIPYKRLLNQSNNELSSVSEHYNKDTKWNEYETIIEDKKHYIVTSHICTNVSGSYVIIDKDKIIASRFENY